MFKSHPGNEMWAAGMRGEGGGDEAGGGVEADGGRGGGINLLFHI